MMINLSEVRTSDFNRKIEGLLPVASKQETRIDDHAQIVYIRQSVECLVVKF